ncbi:VOC family protein [Streptomyces sp. RerS4]|uniref:VOC family protein n=1 Tax=Streptomyces sp. RerS4 TaxID=2942449 RepID=UPI00201BE493|nr:VOC family protein [Streptomyces sp. RerS4]UQX02364.1 VOC family protein [Streptomyces sp. RerS4]
MLGTSFRTGSPNWLDLGTPDTGAAADFYTRVFGWHFVSAGPDAGGYGFFQLGGKTVAALGPLDDEGATSAWTVYFQSPDIQATAQAVTAGGGRVRAEPMDVMGEGWLAQFTDPQGAEFACWQPGKTGGLQATSEDNTLVWVELHVPDPEVAIAFYAKLFGWRSQDMRAPGMTYRVIGTADGDLEDASFGGVAPLREGAGGADVRWVPYFKVPDVDATVSAVRDAGGSVLMPAADVPEVGRIGWVADPAGAVFALLKPAPGM